MKVAVLGAGSLGFAYAAFLSSRGHQVSIWSPSGRGIADLISNGGRLLGQGKVVGEFIISPSEDLQATLEASDVIIFALPGNGHESVMSRAARYLRDEHVIMITPVVSLSASVLSSYTRDFGTKPLICASSTTLLTARRIGGTTVNVMTIRPSVDVCSLPASALNQVIEVLASLFDSVFEPRSSMLEATLSNSGPVIHVPLALMNMTRMERGESWLQYEHFTENVSNVMLAVDRERIAVGAEFGFSFRGIADEFCASFRALPDSLPGVAAQIVKLRNGGPLGPVDASTRYLTEDVPFGLRFLSLAGKLVGVPTPVTDACVTMAAASLGPALSSGNALLDYVGRYASSKRELADFAEGRRG